MIYPAAIRFTYLQCSFVLWRRLFCRHVYFMALFTSVKWTSNSSQQTPLQSVLEKKTTFFSFFLSLFFFFFFFARIYPPGHSKLLCSPTVRLLCLSAAAHLFGFYGLCFSLGSAYAWLGPALLKWWRGGGRKMSGKAIFYSLWCVYGYCSPFVISLQQPDGEKSEENLNKSDKLAWVTPPPTTTCTSDWHWECVV